uniref:Vacuolar protein sorting-associated protein 51 homolog n=1 Tax=Phallusia mammillata TaxID=59560 RepID=A0A6F9DXE9_9ASCI|nr:vacuolar protein sorting-associated protein 51 homolog [Phallusia mammillata]
MSESSENGAGPDQENDQRRLRKNDMLKMYYGMDGGNGQPSNDPLDIDSPNFNADHYLRKLKQENNLSELMDAENDMAKQIRTLDSDMQTLVYENYNKFISATDTIRTMKRDFRQMEDEMEKLTSNMAAITQLNAKINSTMETNRQQITKLSGVHSLLKKLQFLFELPARLKKCLEMGSYAAAVSYYTRTRAVLQHYQHMESFSGIERDCKNIVNEIISKLKETFYDKDSNTHQLAECVGLLLRLGEPAGLLCDDYLQHAKSKLDEDLQELRSYLAGENSAGTSDESEGPGLLIDVLEFMDRGSNGFLSNLSLTIAAYENLFIKQTEVSSMTAAMDGSFSPLLQSNDVCEVANTKLLSFVQDLLETYFALVEKRLMLDKRSRDNALIVRALDRFFRRLQATTNLLPNVNIMKLGGEIIVKVAKARCEHYQLALKEFFTDCLTDARHAISAPKGKSNQSHPNLLDLVNSTASAILNQIKSVLADVQLFTVRDINFSAMTYFRREFCCDDVREVVIVHFIRYISETLLSFCDSSNLSKTTTPPPALLLLLSRLCRDFEQSTVAYVLTLTDEQFMIPSRDKTSQVGDLTTEMGETAHKLLEAYVQYSGLSLSRMIRTSIEARDWLKCVEPRQVRAVMRRVVEEVTQSDQQVGYLYEEGVRTARSSDSSKRTHPVSVSRQRERSHWGAYAPSSTMDNSLLSNIQKLFSERVDVFGPVEFSRTSILTGVVKIALKTLLECVRLKTFSKFGLQQLQVDCHYLQLYLWRFVSDENIVHGLLDEVIASCVHRCVEPTVMEPSVIDVICERG